MAIHRAYKKCSKGSGSIENLRKCEILVDNEWVDTNFRELKAGDTFRLFEPGTGAPVRYRGRTDFIADTDAYIKYDVWTVETE